jgi:hypothetical protein
MSDWRPYSQFDRKVPHTVMSPSNLLLTAARLGAAPDFGPASDTLTCTSLAWAEAGELETLDRSGCRSVTMLPLQPYLTRAALFLRGKPHENSEFKDLVREACEWTSNRQDPLKRVSRSAPTNVSTGIKKWASSFSRPQAHQGWSLTFSSSARYPVLLGRGSGRGVTNRFWSRSLERLNTLGMMASRPDTPSSRAQNGMLTRPTGGT